jgi:redox-sensitive bicupin YhaK (pirin superfamily)
VPSFTHYPANVIPRRVLDGVTLAVIAGDAFGLRSPVVTTWPTLYVHAQFSRGAILEMPQEHDERAVYVAQGELATDEGTIAEGQLAALAPGLIQLRAVAEARVMLLGGNRFPTARHIWWNFVASSDERIERAKERWAKREFPPVPGETEFIPLPSE